MSTQRLQSAPVSAPSNTVTQDQDIKRQWFVLAFPAVLAVLVFLVTVIGTAAAVPFLIVLVPLALWGAFRDTERALYVYIAWCWFDGTIRGLLHSDAVSIVARDIVLGIITIGWGAQRLQNRHRDPIRCPPGTLLVVLFIVNCLLQVFNPYAAGLLQSIGGLKMHLAFIPLLFLGYDVIRRPTQVRSLFLFLTLITLIMGISSYAQYAHGPSWTYAHFPGSKETISQNLGTFNSPGRSRYRNDSHFQAAGDYHCWRRVWFLYGDNISVGICAAAAVQSASLFAGCQSSPGRRASDFYADHFR